jgi:two-component system, OmpR family, response regulator
MKAGASGPRRQGCHILVVEDHKDTREVVTLLLELRGYKVSQAETVAVALQLARTESFDLYLLDSRLPDGSGVELCRSIRQFDGNTPIIFYSASAYETDKREAIACGAQGYLVKPCSPEELEETVEELLKGES